MPGNNYSPWWEAAEGELAHEVFTTYRALRSDSEQVGRFTAYNNYLSLFLNREIHSDLAREYLIAQNSMESEGFSRVPFNLTKMILDMVQNRIAKMRPRVKFLPRGGNHTLHRKARLLERWVTAQFRWMDIYTHAQMAFQDSLLYGTGFLKVWREGERFRVERVYPGEIFVDEVEGYYGCLTQMMHRKYISRRVLSGLFPEHKQALMECGGPDESYAEFKQLTFGDQITVVEAWHLPSSPDAGDGRHTICAEGVTLLDEEWVHDDFPFLETRWSRNPRGFFGIGLAEELAGLHLDLNYMIERRNRAMELFSCPQVWVENSSAVKTSKITNIIGQINTYTGREPKFLTPNGVSVEMLQAEDRAVSRALQIARLSENAINQKIPSGLETGAAVQAWNDTESQGFQIVAQQYEGLFPKAAEWLIRLGKECYEENPRYSVVSSKDKYTIEQVDWAKLDPEEDSYVIETWPVSSLPFHPSGKMQAVEKLVQIGAITPQQSASVLDLPDLEEYTSLARAAEDNIKRIIEDIIDEGIYTPPEPFMDPQLCILHGTDAINKAQANNVPEQHRTLLIKFVRQAKAMLDQARAAEAQAMMPPPTAAAAPPMTASDGSLPQAVPGA